MPLEPVQGRTISVLFVCDDNAATSIMAEAILRFAGAHRFSAYSGGLHPAPRIDPLVWDLLHSRCIPLAGLQPKSCERFARPGAPRLDFVVALSEDAAESFSAWPGDPVTAYWAVDGDTVSDAFWALMRRINIFTGLPHGSAPRHKLESRLRRIPVWL